MILANYKYYTGEYGGKKIPGAEFERHAQHATAYINAATFGRAEGSNLDCVKDAMCAAAEIYHEFDTHMGIISESNDGYSVTYDTMQTADNQIYAVVNMYLANTDLLYRGSRK